MSENEASTGQGQDNNPGNQGQQSKTLDPEALLLAFGQALDQLQTKDKLDANAMDAMRSNIEELTKLVLALKESQTGFRIQGQRLADGTIECVLAGVPVRIDPTSDIAIGAKQIERQRQQAQG